MTNRSSIYIFKFTDWKHRTTVMINWTYYEEYDSMCSAILPREQSAMNNNPQRSQSLAWTRREAIFLNSLQRTSTTRSTNRKLITSKEKVRANRMRDSRMRESSDRQHIVFNRIWQANGAIISRIPGHFRGMRERSMR